MSALASLTGLCGCAAAGTQTAAVAANISAQPQPAGKSPTEAEVAASPAAQKLQAAVAAISTGKESIGAFVASNFPSGDKSEAEAAEKVLINMHTLHVRGQRYTLSHFTRVDRTAAAARFFNHLTQELIGVSVKVEPAAPHRLIELSIGYGGWPVPGAATPATDRERVKEVASLLKRMSDADIFSGVVLIAKNGKPIFQQAYGFANREKRIPNTVNTRFRLASMNKIFTALAIGQLVEQGKLSYEDSLSKFVPDFPDPENAKKIRIKHLLSHTAGLSPYFTDEFWANLDKMTSVQAALDVADRKPLLFEPGTKHEYSNTGMQLLGKVIEVVSGQDYFDYMDRTLFRPNSLSKTGFPSTSYSLSAPDQALPYEHQMTADKKLVFALPKWNPPRGGPAGDAVSNAPDLQKFVNALQSGKIVSPDTLRLHSTAKPELNSFEYGYGMQISRDAPGRDFYGHGGDAHGSCVQLDIVRDLPSPYTFIVLANSSMGSCYPVIRKIQNLFSPASKPGSTAS